MPSFRKCYILSAAMLALGTSTVTAGERWWLDPAIQHTNGMLVAAADPHRSASVCWSCNPDQRGQCGDQYYRPPLDSLIPDKLAARHGKLQGTCGCQNGCNGSAQCACCPACQRMHWQGPAVPADAMGVDGIEAGDTMLGQIPSTSGPALARSAAPMPAAVPSGFQFSLPVTLPGVGPTP